MSTRDWWCVFDTRSKFEPVLGVKRQIFAKSAIIQLYVSILQKL